MKIRSRYIKKLMQRPIFLSIVILATFITGVMIALVGYSLLLGNSLELQLTSTPDGCQIELTVTHDLYDTREDYWENALPIGKLESGIYGVIGMSNGLIAIDWRGDIDIHPATLELTDWILLIEGVNTMSGDCSHVTLFAPIILSLTTVP